MLKIKSNFGGSELNTRTLKEPIHLNDLTITRSQKLLDNFSDGCRHAADLIGSQKLTSYLDLRLAKQPGHENKKFYERAAKRNHE